MVTLRNPNAEIYVPDGIAVEDALARTTHLAISAHQDDIEIMAVDGILQCFQRPDKWFTGVVVTNGSGSPRTGVYADYTDEEMMAVRVLEQKRAAYVGDYAAQALLAYPSSMAKDKAAGDPVEDLKTLIGASSPDVVYTHNLADKHQTHIAVALRVIQALRELPADQRPKKLYGCEVWRNLDWVLDEDKVVFDCSEKENLQAALLGVFDSQISGGKRYDLAALGRRVANATFYASHDTDQATSLAYAMDLTPLIQDIDLDITTYVRAYIQRFSDEVTGMITDVS